jgi:hypothetical protein
LRECVCGYEQGLFVNGENRLELSRKVLGTGAYVPRS